MEAIIFHGRLEAIQNKRQAPDLALLNDPKVLRELVEQAKAKLLLESGRYEIVEEEDCITTTKSGETAIAAPREPRESLRKRAEQHVRGRRRFPGFAVLRDALGCPKSSLHDAFKSSTYLKARKAEYEAKRSGMPKTVSMTDIVLDSTKQTTEPDHVETVDELIADQEADARADEARERRLRRSSRPRS